LTRNLSRGPSTIVDIVTDNNKIVFKRQKQRD